MLYFILDNYLYLQHQNEHKTDVRLTQNKRKYRIIRTFKTFHKCNRNRLIK
jgi:hypothetical protein